VLALCASCPPTVLPKRYTRRPRRTLRSHDRQRTSRKLSVYAAALSSPCAHYFPHYTTQAATYATFARLPTRIKQAQRSQVFETRLRAKGGRGVRYALTIVNAHHVSQARMLPPCAHHVPHCTAPAVHAEIAAYATLARQGEHKAIIKMILWAPPPPPSPPHFPIFFRLALLAAKR
jgi:hypothetical protein